MNALSNVALGIMTIGVMFGMAEVFRWQLTSTWLINPRKLVLPAMGTGMLFGLIGAGIVLVMAVVQPSAMSQPASQMEMVAAMIVTILLSYVCWLSFVAAHRRLAGTSFWETIHLVLRASVPALLITLVLVALLLALKSTAIMSSFGSMHA